MRTCGFGSQVLGKEVGRDHGVSVDTCAAIFKLFRKAGDSSGIVIDL